MIPEIPDTLEHKRTREPVREYALREALHTAIAIGISVLVAVGLELTKFTGFTDAFLTGLLVTVVRTTGTALVTLLGKKVIS